MPLAPEGANAALRLVATACSQGCGRGALRALVPFERRLPNRQRCID